MRVERFINSIFASNTYLLYNENKAEVWLIDPGDSQIIIEWINENKKILKGIFITHAHFDHIYGINDFLNVFPSALIYCSKDGKEGLLNPKINMSHYTEKPFCVNFKENINILQEGNLIELWEKVSVTIYSTPGHNIDCISFQIEDCLFTGDALIPGIKVYTKTKYGNKEQAAKSIERIVREFHPNTNIYPGHKNKCMLKDAIKKEMYKKSI